MGWVMRYKHYLEPLFSPTHIAIVGASERPNSLGQTVFSNLMVGKLASNNEDLRLSPVNPKYKTVYSLPCVKRLQDLPEPPDMVVVVTPPAAYTEILGDCKEAGVTYAVFIKPQDEQSDDQQTIFVATRMARRLGIRLIGPTFFGMIRPSAGINASTYGDWVHSGNVAFVGHSASLCSAILDWAAERRIGFSAVMSFGSEASSLEYGEVLDFLANDSATEAIILHIHHTMNGRRFMSALRAASRIKPVLILHSGRSDKHSVSPEYRVAHPISHEEIFSSAMRRAGVLEGDNFGQIFHTVGALANKFRTQGNRLSIVCNGLGLGLIAADEAITKGIELAEFDSKTYQALSKKLPNLEIGNPLNLSTVPEAEQFGRAVELCLDNSNTDGVLVVYSPQGYDPVRFLKTAEVVADLQKKSAKPLFLSWVGGKKIEEATNLFANNGCLDFAQPEYAIGAFRDLVRFNENRKMLRSLYVEKYRSSMMTHEVGKAKEIIAQVKEQGRVVLSEYLTKKLLACFDIQCNYTTQAANKEEALKQAELIGFPVALKIDSPDILHKSNIGGIALHIKNTDELEAAYDDVCNHVMVNAPYAAIDGVSIQSMLPERHIREVKVCIVRDPIFGPAIVFAASSNIAYDRAVALPPLTETIINQMIAQANVSAMLGSYKHMHPVDKDALYDVLFNVSEIACELPEISELDIDLLLSPQGAMVADARALLGGVVPEKPYGHTAIMPYPRHFEQSVVLRDGTPVRIRPVRALDSERVQNFVRGLSEQSRRTRFMSNIKELSEEVLVNFTRLDYNRDMALLMINQNHDILGIARYAADPDLSACEFAVTVSDAHQGKGIATILMNSLFYVARCQGFKTMYGEVLANNTNMLAMSAKLGFIQHNDPNSDEEIVIIVKSLIEPEERV
ncbi:MAG: bifunctional acetate--CoA ligase family protein/GNAT family N-acetyltransferase [Neisseriaceae bacterium]|nr:bifunctional acetate--CoA ligase family protein/GNAT family N-acetyltransferase [Neisseriaceae bacterium]